LRRSHAARSAPFCPEIRKYRNPRILHDFIKLLAVNLQWFVNWRERSFACAAPAGIGEVSWRNAVFAITRFACPNNAHKCLWVLRCRTKLRSRGGYLDAQDSA